MRIDDSNQAQFFDTQQVLQIVGIRAFYLNRFVERSQYGIAPSVRSGSGRGSRRLFSSDDIDGIALVWWLFESGLRSRAIEYVLNQVCGGKLNSKANDAAKILIDDGWEILVVRRWPRESTDAGREYPKQEVFRVDSRKAAQLVNENQNTSLLVVPTENLFAGLKKTRRP